MKLLYYIPLLLLLAACGPQSNLERTYNPNTYKVDLTRLLKDTASLSQEDAVLINYAILRQNSYRNYEVVGKTFQEILDMAKSFQKNGLPYEEVIEENGAQDLLTTKVFNEGPGLVKKKANSSRLQKMLNFSCEYKNDSGKDVVLLTSSFIIRGPLKDHVMTSGYEINCLIKNGEKLNVEYIADPKLLRRNLFFDKKSPSDYLGTDLLLAMMDIETSGHSLTTNTEFFKECYQASGRRPSFVDALYSKDSNSPGHIEPVQEGDVFKIKLGKAHFLPKESNEPIEIYELKQQ